MKSTTLLATFASLYVIKFVNGQQNNVVPRENFGSFNYLPQNQPTNKITKNVDMLLDQNGNIIPLPKNANQNEILMQTNTPQPVASVQQIQLPPDIKPQPLQVQQHLKLQSPLQIQQQQSFPLQAQLQTQTPLQSQQSLQLQPQRNSQLPIQNTPASSHLQTPPVQSQISLQSHQPVLSKPHLPPQVQLQPQIQTQPKVQTQLQTQPHPQVEEQPKLPIKEPLQLQQQPLQPQQSHIYLEPSVSLPSQQLLQAQQPLRELMAFKLPQSLYPQSSQSSQLIPQLTPTIQQQNSAQKLTETLNLVEAGTIQQKNIYQPNLQTNFRWLSPNPSVTPNIEKSNVLNIEDNRKSVISPVDIIPNIQKSNIQDAYKNSENPSFTYYLASQQSPPSPVVSALVPNSYSNVIVPSPNIKPAEGANIPVVSPYTYKPVSDSNSLVGEITEPVNLIPQTPPILKVPSSSFQNTYYFNQQNTDPTPNSYVGRNVRYHYPQQSSYPVIVLQSHPSTIYPSPSPILSSISIPTIQAPSVSSQYGYSSSYPLNTIVAPAFRSQSSKSSNLKSFMPLIFNLLKEKIASCACQNDCQCPCKNNNIVNELEVSSGYSNQKRYGANNDDHLSVLNTVCKESEGIECPRERKNCEKIEAATSEISNETQEDEESEEEDVVAEVGEEEADEEDSEEE